MQPGPRDCGETVNKLLDVLDDTDVVQAVNESDLEEIMATNKPTGDGHRTGAVKKRSQLKTNVMGEEHYTIRSKATGQFMDQKADDEKFKGVRKEKTS